MNKNNILIFPGDEVGPEITTEAIKIIDFLNESKLTNISYEFAHIGGAALDVFNTEPYHGKLINLDNILLTPHIGSYAAEIRAQMELESVENLIENLIF